MKKSLALLLSLVLTAGLLSCLRKGGDPRPVLLMPDEPAVSVLAPVEEPGARTGTGARPALCQSPHRGGQRRGPGQCRRWPLCSTT